MKVAPPTLAIYWQAEVTKTETKKLVRRTRKYRCRSFVGNFLRTLHMQMSTTAATITDTAASSFTAATNSVNFSVSFTATDHQEGIVLGTGTTAVTAADYVLATLITDGVGAGQLDYPASTTVGSLAIGSSTAAYDISRSFANSSGGSITVQEIGLVCGVDETGAPGTRSVLMIRDLTGGIAVGNGQTLTVTYTITTTI